MKKIIIILILLVFLLSGCSSLNSMVSAYKEFEVKEESAEQIDVIHNQNEYFYPIPATGFTYKISLNCYDNTLKVTYKMLSNDEIYSVGTLSCGESITTDASVGSGKLVFTLEGYSEEYIENNNKTLRANEIDDFGEVDDFEDMNDGITLGNINIVAQEYTKN